MNLVGKILVILILVMSITFMGFAVAAYNTQTVWRDTIMRTSDEALKQGKEVGLKFQLKDLQDEVQRLSTERAALEEELNNERDRKAAALAKMEHYSQTLQQERDTLKAELKTAEEENQTLITLQDSNAKNLTAAIQERDKLRADIRDTIEERNKYFQEVVKLTDEYNEAHTMWDRLKDTNLKLSEQISGMEMVFNQEGINWEAVAAGLDPPVVEGLVLKVARDRDLVELSIGSDDGLSPGHELNVVRGTKFLGRIKVQRVEADRAVAQIIPELQAAPIEQGDEVRTPSSGRIASTGDKSTN